MSGLFARLEDARAPLHAPAFWFVVAGTRLLVLTDGKDASVPFGRSLDAWGIGAADRQYLGQLRGSACYAVEADGNTPIAAGTAFAGVRELFGALDEDVFKQAFAAVHLVEWDRTSRFCGRCGGPTRPSDEERAKSCPACGHLIFPRISPAIIVLVEREDRVLLARAARFTKGFYSVLAGFVEAGESLEEAVAREVEEETAIRVKDIRYFASQPWPFPDSLMVGFTAAYASGELRIDEKEIVEAGWYRVGDLPQLPGRVSIARRLIDWFIEKHTHVLSTGNVKSPP